MTIQQHASFDSSAAELNATSKLVKAWESKNAKNAARAGGVSLMALSLAACGGSDDVAVDITSDNAEILLAAVTAVDATATTVAEVASNANAAGVATGEAAANGAIDQAIVDAGITVAADATSAEIIAAVAASDNTTVADTAKTTALTTEAGTTYATVDAAFTAGSNTNNADAVAAALTDAGGTSHATVDAAITSNDTAIADAATTAANATAEATLVAGTGFDTVADLNAAYTAAIAATPALASDLSTGSENVFGTVNDDVIAGTFTTYTTGDIITDGTATDNDTLTVTTTDDIAATPVVSGIENVNFVLTSVGAGATVPATFAIDSANINATTLTASATNAATVVTTVALTNVKTGVTVVSDIATVNVATVADADTTVNATGATQTVVQSGTTDTLAITGGNLTVNDVTAEEAITITATGTVSMTDATANAAATDVAISITADGDVTVADVTDTGSLTVVSGGDIVVGGTDLFSDGVVTLTTTAGDITVTDADDATSLVINAVGAGPADVTTASDGAIIVTSADVATTAVLNSTDSITITELLAATDITMSAAADSGITDVDAIENLTLSSTSTAATPIVYAMTATDGQTLETVTFTGTNDVTFAMDATDLVAAASATQALVATDTGSGTSRIAVSTDAAGAGLDLSGLAIDEIEIAFNQGTNQLTFANGANVVVSANQTDLTTTAAAVAGNVLNLKLDSGTATTGVTLSDLSVSNNSVINVTMADDALATHVISLAGVGASTAVNISGNGGLTFGTISAAQVAGSVDASGVSGDITANVVMAGSFKAGTGDDTINISDAVSTTRIIDGGDGADSLVFAASDNFSAASLTLSGIETINVAAADSGAIIVAGSQMSGKGYNIVGDSATADDFQISAQSGTGETIDISSSEIVLAAVTINGAAGADTLTGSATGAATFVGGAGADTITGGSGVDTFLFTRALTPTTDRDIITNGEDTDVYAIQTSTGGALTAPFAALTDGDGAASAFIANGATANTVVASGIYVDGGAVNISAATADILVFYGGTTTGTAGIANGLDGLYTALATGTQSIVSESAGTKHTAGDQMFVVVENTTTAHIEVGVITEVGGDGFGVGTDTVTTLFEIAITDGLTALEVATAVDYFGIA